jgi:hypothetical protein
MPKSKARKAPEIFVKVNMNGCDKYIVNRLYSERDTKTLDSMGVRVAAVPARCFKNTIMWKPLVLQDKRSWRDTRPKAPSSLRKCEVSVG